jgi:hypothetical protein
MLQPLIATANGCCILSLAKGLTILQLLQIVSMVQFNAC